jgi:hypothetical protein
MTGHGQLGGTSVSVTLTCALARLPRTNLQNYRSF